MAAVDVLTQPEKQLDWAAEAERDQKDEVKDEYDDKSKIRTVVYFKEEEKKEMKDGREVTYLIKYQVTSKFKRVEKSVPRIVADRKKWSKFGECITDNAGVNPSNCYVDQEQKWEWIRNATGEEIIEQAEPKDKVSTGVANCRICKSSDHWTVQCPYKDQLGEVDEPVPSQEEEQAKAGGGYIAPHLRAGGAGPMLGSMGQRQEESLRITNLPPDTMEIDLRQHIQEKVLNTRRQMRGQSLNAPSSFGRITRLYLARKKNREGDEECKGFAYVTFDAPSVAEYALEQLQGSRFNYSILSVEWSQRKN